MTTKGYWENKEDRAEKALAHTSLMEAKYSDRISSSIESTTVYNTNFHSFKVSEIKTKQIILDDTDSVSAVFKYAVDPEVKTAVLNFSSYKNPGGMFIKGSRAQEECLCHESDLYNILKEIPEFYQWNKQNTNKALYMNRGLYVPEVVFERDSKTTVCDVITCAAPNKFAAQKYYGATNEENLDALTERIQFVLDIAKENDVQTLILGAYGCGVFGQNATEVASIFKDYLANEYSCFDTKVFAIPSGNSNYKKFVEVFEE